MKSFLIIGMDSFGHHICRELNSLNCEVMIADIKEEALGLLFARMANGRTLSDDPAAKDYLSGMVHSANYALTDLAGITPLRRSMKIAHFAPHNLLGCRRAVNLPGGRISFEAEGAGSFFARVTPGAVVAVRQGQDSRLLECEHEPGHTLGRVRCTFSAPAAANALDTSDSGSSKSP